MASVSQKQHDLMVKVAEDAELAEKLKIPQEVAKEFVEQDALIGLWQTDVAVESAKQKVPKYLNWR